MVGDYVGGWEGASVSRWGERDSRFHGNDGLGRRDDGEEGRGPFDVPQGERNPVPPGSPFERLRASGSRFPPVHPSISLRANGSQAPRFALREPQGERNPVPPSAQAQARPFESLRANGTRFPPVHPSGGSGQALRANGTRFPPVHPSAGSGQALREAQGERNTALPVRPSAGSGQALREAQGERNTAPPGSPFGRLRAGPSRASGRTEHGFPPAHPSAGSGQALREPQGERNTVQVSLREPQGERNPVPLRPQGERNPVPGSPFGRLRAGPSRGSGRAEHGSPRSPFESRAQASGQALREAGPSRASGQALREPQGRPFESLRAGTRFPPVQGRPFGRLREPQGRPFGLPGSGPSAGLRAGPSRASGRAELRFPPAPFGRLRAGPSRASGRAEHGSVHPSAGSGRALREPQGERNTALPGTLRQAQARPFESLRASGTRLSPAHPSAGSGQALREPQGERNTALPGSPFGRLRAGPSRASGRTVAGSPRSPFGRLRAGPSRGSGRTESLCGGGAMVSVRGIGVGGVMVATYFLVWHNPKLTFAWPAGEVRKGIKGEALNGL